MNTARQNLNSDRPDAPELAEKIYDLAVMLRDRYGMYEQYNSLKDAAGELEVLDAELADERAKVSAISLELVELRNQLATYRVFEVRPATRLEPAEHVMRESPSADENE